MNVSLPPDPSVDISPVTSQSLKRSNPTTVTKNDATRRIAPKPPKRRKKTAKKSYDFDDDEGNDDEYNSRLSAQTRDTVLKLRKIKDPFDQELQKVVDNVFEHIERQKEEDVSLAESALLLSSVTHVYSSQVKSLHEEVLEIAARLTGKESPKARNRKKKGEEQKGEGEVDGDGKPSEQNPGEGPAASTTEGGEAVATDTGDSKIADTADDNNNDKSGVDCSISDKPKVEGEGQDTAEGLPSPGDENPVQGSSEPNPENQAGGESTENNDGATATEGTSELLQSEILNEIVGPCTRRQSERLKKILNLKNEKEKERDYTLKKRKYDDDPPELISCHEEWKQILESVYSKGDIDFDEILPPALEIQVGRKRKKLMINNNEDVDMDGPDCETCQNAESQKEDKNKDENAIKAIMSACVGDNQYETLDHLSNDVQERFHSLIEEIHKLPYDYGLMHQQDMFKEYQHKFLQAVTLLSQNSVLVKKRNEAAAEDTTTPATTTEEATATVNINDTQVSESDQTISAIDELLNQVRQQAAEEYNKGKQSKSDAEVPIGQMIATLKRIICGRYKKWQLRADHDKAVIRRIKRFEDKVKAVLKREAEQGLFDVKKYEMEVMDVTLKESQDVDADEYFSPTSPVTLQDGAVSPRPEDPKTYNLPGTSRRTSVAGSLDGSSWIRLLDIFSHMKKIDNSETCRHFYAVLGLLSHKNLAVNYDALFSKESAKVIAKLLKTQKEGVNQEKYPVGAKIMTSRCPDIDRDEVFLAPVFNSDSLQQALEQDYLSSSGYQSDSQASSSTSFSPAPPQQKTIQEAISEFVVDEGEPLAIENLFGKRRRKNN